MTKVSWLPFHTNFRLSTMGRYGKGKCLFPGKGVNFRGEGGYSSMIWVGTCCWDLKSRPIFVPNFAEKWDPSYARATNFKQNLLTNFTFFPKIVKLSSTFRKFWYQIDKITPIFLPIQKVLNIWPMFIPVFVLNKGSSITRRLILRPTSAAHPRRG